MEVFVNSKEEIKSLDTAKMLKEAEEIFNAYHEIALGYQSGAISLANMISKHQELYQRSQYTDKFDFLHDYNRYKVGLPLYININVLGKEEKR